MTAFTTLQLVLYRCAVLCTACAPKMPAVLKRRTKVYPTGEAGPSLEEQALSAIDARIRSSERAGASQKQRKAPGLAAKKEEGEPDAALTAAAAAASVATAAAATTTSAAGAAAAAATAASAATASAADTAAHAEKEEQGTAAAIPAQRLTLSYLRDRKVAPECKVSWHGGKGYGNSEHCWKKQDDGTWAPKRDVTSAGLRR